MTGFHRDTVMRLGVRIGEGCQRIMDNNMRDLPCRLIQVDELWGYCRMKQKTRTVTPQRATLAMSGHGLLLIRKQSSSRLSRLATAPATWQICSLKIWRLDC